MDSAYKQCECTNVKRLTGARSTGHAESRVGMTPSASEYGGIFRVNKGSSKKTILLKFTKNGPFTRLS